MKNALAENHLRNIHESNFQRRHAASGGSELNHEQL
jgi:hypothetical protein